MSDLEALATPDSLKSHGDERKDGPILFRWIQATLRGIGQVMLVIPRRQPSCLRGVLSSPARGRINDTLRATPHRNQEKSKEYLKRPRIVFRFRDERVRLIPGLSTKGDNHENLSRHR
jgi:hypothetical protein